MIPIQPPSQPLGLLPSQHVLHQLQVLQRDNSRQIGTVTADNHGLPVGGDAAQDVGVFLQSLRFVHVMELWQRESHGPAASLK